MVWSDGGEIELKSTRGKMRLMIHHDDGSESYADFGPESAQVIGQALVEWASRFPPPAKD